MKGKRFSLTLLSLFALPTLAATPSFDCTKASSSVEELICSNNELATLDNTLNTVYKQAMANYPSAEKKQQKAM
ncbi:lysozyme inhibitor LprI family protein [Photobacterium damselae]|nr:lysozyme inhibitor LprI family protein [Photobacterium damselae]